jgi:hypothetical protein
LGGRSAKPFRPVPCIAPRPLFASDDPHHRHRGSLAGAAGGAAPAPGRAAPEPDAGFGDLLNQSLRSYGEPDVPPAPQQEAAAELLLRAMIQAA